MQYPGFRKVSEEVKTTPNIHGPWYPDYSFKKIKYTDGLSVVDEYWQKSYHYDWTLYARDMYPFGSLAEWPNAADY